MLNKNVKWNDSETKKIYNANPETEKLMEYLEKVLFEKQLVDSCADSPNYDRSYGVMIYYKQGRRILTAAPRKREKHVHVVFSKNLDSVPFEKAGIRLGRQSNDVFLSEKEQIDNLPPLMEQMFFVKEVQDSYNTRSLEDWLILLREDEKALLMEKAIIAEREKFLFEFNELDDLRNRVITIAEFKKSLDQKAKKKFEYGNKKINIWGFSGPSGQMFFNQLYNQAEYLNRVHDLTDIFLETIKIPEHNDGDLSWTKEKYEKFGSFVKELRRKAISQGYPPQKCPAIKSMTFFISFFWGIQSLEKYPIFYKASRDGLEFLGYTMKDDESIADGNRYIQFVDCLIALHDDLSLYIDKQTIDMRFLSHFLYYIVTMIEQEGFEDDPEDDPIIKDSFAIKIRNTLFEQGYKMAQMETADNESLELGEEYADNLIWHYSGHHGDNLSGVLFVWENEEDFNARVYLVNSEGQLVKGTTLYSENEEGFLQEMVSYLKKASSKKKPYTVEDLAKETYIDQESLEEWLEILTEKRQVILYGPPGTGKTFVAERLAKVLSQQSHLIQLIQFHPSYTYEEFIEGLRPEVIEINNTQQISVKIEPGIFSKLCFEASKPENQNKSYVLIIDEINRANTAKVFGELLYALEYRNSQVPLPYSKKQLVVPENIYIIGTMNTTDRSLAQIDFALRRRFQFIPFTTIETQNVLEQYLSEHQQEMIWVASLVKKVNELIDDPDISIGHSYFIGQELSMKKLERIWKFQISPYLEECFVHDRERLAQFELSTLLDMDDFDE